jgi:hypothetical protein
MPRASNPIDKVLEYFKHADINAADVALHMIKGILKDRRAAGETAETVVRKKRLVRKAKPASTPAGERIANSTPSGV